MPFLDGAGKPRQYLAIRYDITARKRAEADLRARGPGAPGQIAAIVAHEVRNPLAGLRASLQVVERASPSPAIGSAMAAMIQRIDGLNDKVKDLLLYARPNPPRLHSVDDGRYWSRWRPARALRPIRRAPHRRRRRQLRRHRRRRDAAGGLLESDGQRSSGLPGRRRRRRRRHQR